MNTEHRRRSIFLSQMLVVDIDVDVVLIVDKGDYLIVGKRDYCGVHWVNDY